MLRFRGEPLLTVLALCLLLCSSAWASPTAGGGSVADLAPIPDRPIATSARLAPGPVQRGGALVPVLRFPQRLGDSPLVVLYDNGPLVTHPGGGFGGADASRLQTGLLMNTLGFGHQLSLGYRMADDFTVTDPDGWQVDTITFFAYQTGSTTTSTINDVRVQIWDGPPNAGGVVVWGDLTTNRLASSAFTNIYRDSETTPNVNNRPIMSVVATIGTSLLPGTYWLDWTVGGTLASGPWAPPVTILGQTTTGNGLQYTTAWAPANDTGTLTQQGLPFVVEGSVLVNASIALSKTVGLVPGVCGTDETLSVPFGTPVTYCYTVTNTGTVSLETHTLVDDQLGVIFQNFSYTLDPGASAFLTIDDVVLDATTTNVATWTASAIAGGVGSCSAGGIVITGAQGTPYPSPLAIAGAPTSPSTIIMLLGGVAHTWPDDIDVLLVGPGGQSLIVMSDAGGSDAITGVDLELEDFASAALPDNGVLGTGNYRAADYAQQGDAWPAPAPAPPYGTPEPTGADTFTSIFGGLDPNGTWNLYVSDAFPGGDDGSIGQWCLAALETIEASASDAVTVTVLIPDIAVSPVNLSSVQGADTQVTLPLDIQNVGTADLDWTVGEAAAPTDAANGTGTYLNQAPNQVNGLFADSTCALCGTGQQSIAENFTLAAPATIGQITFWGGYFSTNTPLATDVIRVLIHSDAAGLPGAVVYDESNVASTRVQTGVVLFGVDEWEFTLTLAAPVNLGPGTYWIELFNNTAGNPDDFFWETGNLDPTHGLTGSGWTTATPGVAWNFDGATDMAIQIDGPASPCFTPADLPWLSVSPTAGTTPPATTDTVDVTFDSAGLSPGTVFDGLVCVESNDPDTPLVEVPVTLTVDSMPFFGDFEEGNTSDWTLQVP